MEYYSALKRNEIMSFAVAWMNLEITILSEVRQTEKVKSFAISHVESFFFFLIWNSSRICVSFLRRGHANLLCIVPILVYVLLK